jgi:hypothetical protein
MRHHQRGAMSYALVERAVALSPLDVEERRTRQATFEVRAERIDDALRLAPFPIEAR